jgi:hypothetical protein
MRAPQRHRDRYGSRARENSFVVMEKFSWEAAANKALRVLDERKVLSDDLFPNAHVTPQSHPLTPSQVHQADIAKHMPRTNLARNAPCFCGSEKNISIVMGGSLNNEATVKSTMPVFFPTKTMSPNGT